MGAKKKFFVDTGYAFITFSFLTFIRFLRKPILARFLGPEGMGLFSMIVMITGMIERFAALGIPVALIKFSAEIKDDRKLDEILSSAYISLLLIGFLSSLLLIAFSNRIAIFFEMPDLSLYLKIYAVATPFSLLYSINLSLFNGKREMKNYSSLEIIKSILNFILILFLLYMGYEIIGVLIGSIAALLITLYISMKMLYGRVSLNLRGFYDGVKKLVSFGIKLMLAGTINLLNYEADILLIGYFLAAQDVGYYSVAISLTHFLWIIPDSIQKISYPTTAEYWASQEYGHLNVMFDKTIKLSTIFMLIIGVTVTFYAEIIIQLLFGSDFLNAVTPLQILIWGTIVYGSLNKPVGSSLAAAGLANIEVYKVFISAAINVLLNLTLIPIYGIIGGAIATTISLIVASFINVYFMIKMFNFKFDVKWFIVITIITLIVFIMDFSLNFSFLIKTIVLLIYYGILLRMLPKKEIIDIWNSLYHKILKNKENNQN